MAGEHTITHLRIKGPTLILLAALVTNTIGALLSEQELKSESTDDQSFLLRENPHFSAGRHLLASQHIVYDTWEFQRDTFNDIHAAFDEGDNVDWNNFKMEVTVMMTAEDWFFIHLESVGHVSGGAAGCWCTLHHKR